MHHEIIRGHNLFFNYQSGGYSKSTLRNYKSLLDNFFNHIENTETIDPEFHNPCDNPVLLKLSARLKVYVQNKEIEDGNRIFLLPYPTARMIVKKAGELVGVGVRPHDLRRHAATYASRSGTPLEIVSKVILRHSNLSMTQLYLGKISDLDSMRWIDSLHG